MVYYTECEPRTHHILRGYNNIWISHVNKTQINWNNTHTTFATVLKQYRGCLDISQNTPLNLVILNLVILTWIASIIIILQSVLKVVILKAKSFYHAGIFSQLRLNYHKICNSSKSPFSIILLHFTVSIFQLCKLHKCLVCWFYILLKSLVCLVEGVNKMIHTLKSMSFLLSKAAKIFNFSFFSSIRQEVLWCF